MTTTDLILAPYRDNLARNVMRATAGLQADEAGRQVHKPAHKLVAGYLDAHRDSAALIEADEVECVLADAAWLGLVPKQESTGDRTKEARQQVPAHALRAGRPRRPRAASRRGGARLVALDRSGLQTPRASQSVGDHARQQACPHCLGRACPWSRLRPEAHH